MEVHGGVCGGARKCEEVRRGVCGGVRRCAKVCGGALNFLGKMVDISTWRCRIGTFSQKSKKVFHVLNSQGKKVIVISCYFSCFVVSVNVALNLLFI